MAAGSVGGGEGRAAPLLRRSDPSSVSLRAAVRTDASRESQSFDIDEVLPHAAEDSLVDFGLGIGG